MSTVPIGDGQLRVTVRAQTLPGTPANQLRALRFETVDNALIDAGGRSGMAGGFTATLPAGATETSFLVRRATAGRATMVTLVVVDGCGDWRTFVGAGPNGL